MENQTENKNPTPLTPEQAKEQKLINIQYHILGAAAVSPEEQRKAIAAALSNEYKAGFDAGYTYRDNGGMRAMPAEQTPTPADEEKKSKKSGRK